MAVNWNDAAVIEAVRRGATRGVGLAAHIVHGEAVRLITTGSKTGRVYSRRGVKHRASAPGQAPASDTGRLAQAGRVTIVSGLILARVSFSTKYARALERGSAYKIGGGGGVDTGAAQREMGTQTLAPRPFLRPALMNKRREIASVIQGEVAVEIRKLPRATRLLDNRSQGRLF